MTKATTRTIESLIADGSILAIQDGNHGEAHPKASEYVPDGIPFIMASDIRDGTVLLKQAKRLPKARTDKLRIGFAFPGDVLLTHKGTVGEAAIAPDVPHYLMLTPQVTYYRTNSQQLDARYLAFAFRSSFFQAQLANVSAQSTRPYVSITTQRRLLIDWHEPVIQRRIASILGAYDDLIDVNWRRIALLEEMARRLFEEWFVRFRFPVHEAHTAMAETVIGSFPGWKTISIDELCSRVTDGAHKSPPSVKAGIPMASVKDMQHWDFDLSTCRAISKEDFDELVRNDCKPLKGDILIAKDGSYLKHTFMVRQERDLVILSSIAILRPNGRMRPSLFLQYLRDHATIKRMKGIVSGVAVPRIVLKDFKKFLLPLPPRDLQMPGTALLVQCNNSVGNCPRSASIFACNAICSYLGSSQESWGSLLPNESWRPLPDVSCCASGFSVRRHHERKRSDRDARARPTGRAGLDACQPNAGGAGTGEPYRPPHVPRVDPPARFRAALRKLNPSLPSEALQEAELAVTANRAAMLPIAANRDVYRLLREGVPVQVKQPDGSMKPERVTLIDWANPAANDFFLGSQFWIESDLYKRRPDAVGFVNGIPLLMIEWKDLTQPVQEAYDDNLRDYRDTIPRLFDFNGFTILSKGLEALMGPSHAPFEAFAPWKRLEEDGPESAALETMLRATCEPTRFLDLVESFLMFEDARGGLRKVLAKYHQVLGVNRAIDAVNQITAKKGRLGVFWHTQGSGKSLSMAMFTEKVLRRLGGNWTFVLITDRQELDEQLANTFAALGVLTKNVNQCQAQSRVHLRELLAGQERYIFTLIHKFSTERGELMPVLSERSDIIVITDEAHRSQYDQLAANMRRALPNAAFIGFTGTPLIAGQEERTRDVFGDYVSVYNFAQSIADGATVPLYYEARKPELQLATDELKDELDELLDEAALDEEQEKKVQREFGRQYQLITRPDRLDQIAKDVVQHFAARGYRGKAMLVAIDKATAVRMYDKVRKEWAAELTAREQQLASAPEEARAALAECLDWMRSVDMAVVVSQSQNEIDDLKQKGLDILPHRERMQKEDLDSKFKDADDPLRLVFVCAMWITGFDVPTCSTMYLDKPMKNHTLMQAIARANRRAPGKTSGVIVDYVGVFQNLQKALAIYATRETQGQSPIKDKDELVKALEEALAKARAFCTDVGVGVDAIFAAEKLARLTLISQAVEALVSPDERRRGFFRVAGAATRAYRALLPDDRAAPYLKPVATLHVLAEALRGKLGPVDISAVSAKIEALLDEKIEGVAITAPIIEGDEAGGRVDLSSIDFEKLATMFAQRPRTAAERLRADVEKKAREMVERNPTRIQLVEKLEKLVEAYNLGSLDVEVFFEALKKLIAEMEEEERRAAREGLTEEELAIFDLLTKPEPKLTKAQEAEVKKVARDLLVKLQDQLDVFDWRGRQQTRAAVQSTIRFTLNELPQEPYPEGLWDRKVDAVWAYIFSRNQQARAGAQMI